MIKKICTIFLLFLLFLPVVNSEITASTPNNEDSSGDDESTSQDSTNNQNSQQSDFELPSQENRFIEFNRDTTITGETGRRFDYETKEDYITIMNHREENRHLDLSQNFHNENQNPEFYYISSGNENGEEGERDNDVKYFQRMNECEENPSQCGIEEVKIFNENDDFDAADSFNDLADEVVNLNRDISDLEESRENFEEDGQEFPNQQKLDDLIQERQQKQEFIRETMDLQDYSNLISNINEEDLSEDEQEKLNILSENMDVRSESTKTVNQIISEVRDGRYVDNDCESDECLTSEEYNEELNEEVSNLDIVDEQCGGDIEGCELECDSQDNLCQTQQSIIEGINEEKNSQEYIEDSYGIISGLSALFNINQNDLEASKFFGFESRFNDLPTFLQEDIPSQVCLYEIDGYLDTQRQTQTGDVTGSTQYSCPNDRQARVDPQTGEASFVGENPCVEVVGDIRSQRTPITPDNEVEITYSGFAKAPQSRGIDVEVNAKYSLNGEQIEETLHNFSLSGNEDENFFNIQYIPVNQTKYNFSNFDDNQTIKINLLATYKNNNNNYLDLETDAYLVTRGDVYQDPLRE